jgi:hypothetical protein
LTFASRRNSWTRSSRQLAYGRSLSFPAPDAAKLTQQQIGLALARAVPLHAPAAFVQTDRVMCERTNTEIDLAGPDWRSRSSASTPTAAGASAWLLGNRGRARAFYLCFLIGLYFLWCSQVVRLVLGLSLWQAFGALRSFGRG